ncbi:PAP2-domain-containing protein [Fomitiporia mediterranea MF3/22]|uniref:PAP2-domain-containing protein n=1 Tax=Fomitiporia mediterranea (strain MF3/22) TaxID=694068 RepID=UPI0004409A7F|nr:PAP2-domain-containing protein [Fomitiporia mediterranea MF3/22]EJC99978.1 PAP2-domain-containing protein [Fomitiporia mediterranea MF3/22]
MTNNSAPAALELTHVLYDPDSHVSLALALVTLSPILLMASYAALAVVTRDLLIIHMWAGQFACEGFNWLLKHLVKQGRPPESLGNGYGFPSSHSQYMGYFAAFLYMHLFFRHRFTSTGYWIIDTLWRVLVYIGLAVWTGIVCYSRLYLTYHTIRQILWGAGVGVALGVLTYTVTELIPFFYPDSPLGRFRRIFLSHPIITWLRIKDGWAIWEDGGREAEWLEWRRKWETKNQSRLKRE